MIRLSSSGRATPVRVMTALVLIAAPAALPAQTQPDEQRSGDAPSSGIDAEKLFATTCGWCHQDGGRVAGRGPKLAGSEYPDAYLVQRIKNGKEGAMPAYSKTLSDAQIRAIVAYIRSL